MSERIMVCGLGHVGYRVARLLSRLGVSVVVIAQEARADWAKVLDKAGIALVRADARDEAELARAGVDQASALVAATGSDLANLEVALDARRLSPELRLVLRLFDRDLARSLEQSFGRARALGASALSAPVMASAAVGHPIQAALELPSEMLYVGRVRVEKGSPLLGLDAGEARERLGVHVSKPSPAPIAVGDTVTLLGERSRYLDLGQGVAVEPSDRAHRPLGLGASLGKAWRNAPRPLRTVFLTLLALNALSVVVFRYFIDPPISLIEAVYYTVTTVTTVGYGDITPRTGGAFAMLYATGFMLLGSVTMAVLYSFATSYVVSEQLRAELGRPPLPRGRHVIVVGLGNVGYRTWDELSRAGYPVVAVDLDPNGEFVNALRARCPVVLGDARLPSTLAAAGIDRAIAVVAASSDDAVNLAVALKARRLAPEVKTVVRVFDADFAHKLEDGGLVDVATSTSRLAAPAFAAAAIWSDVVGAFVEEDELVALCRKAVPAAWSDKSPAELGVEVAFVEDEKGTAPCDPKRALVEGSSVLVIERRRFV
jgi:Trk K+ transport system NAD-binding subunit